MSKFLGPIHYMMYDKIKFQDKITESILDKEELEKLNEALPAVEDRPLDEIIDQDNIHGFLSSKIDIVESRLSYALKHGKDVLTKVYEVGKSVAPESFLNQEDMFTKLNNYILDGMPCDHALCANLDDDFNLVLSEVSDVHEKYENNPLSINPDDSRSNTCEGDHDHDDHESFHVCDGKIDLNSDEEVIDFYLAREAFLKGFFEKSGHEVKRVGKNFIIK